MIEVADHSTALPERSDDWWLDDGAGDELVHAGPPDTSPADDPPPF